MLEGFNLSWKTLPQHLEATIRELYHEEKYTDVSLVSDDQIKFRAHRIILRACSPVFRNIIDSHPGQHPLIYLRGIQSQEIQSILEFIYQGEARLSYDRLPEFFKVSQDLKVKEINVGLSSPLVSPSYPEEPREKIKTKSYHSEVSEDIMDIYNFDTSSVDTDSVDTGSVDTGSVDTDSVDITSVDTGNIVTFSVDTGSVDISSVDTCSVDTRSEHELVKNVTEEIRKEKPANSNLEHKTYPCNRCDYQAASYSTIKEHISSHHKRKMFLCTYCDYKTDKQSALRIHTEGQHEGIRYPCNQCDYQATQMSNLGRHIQTVHEQVKYPSHHCDAQYKDKRHLKKHILTYHR